MKRLFPSFSVAEYLVALAVLISSLSIIYRHELIQWEQAALQSIGLPRDVWYVLVGLLFGLFIYRKYRYSARQAKALGQPTIRWQVWVIASVGFAIAITAVLLQV